MAVFTKLNHNQIKNFVSMYDIGELENFSEIIEGIENTNYKIICGGVSYILTIFEKRVDLEDLPFFINLKFFLNKNNFKCPKPISDKRGKIINNIENKKAVIITFLEGVKVEKVEMSHCNEVGKTAGELHSLTKNFNEKRRNSLDFEEWKKICKKCELVKNIEFVDVFQNLKKEISFIEKNWPNKLPSGIIHADLFKDNIFFNKNKISGVIDFYFSCYHFYIYDIAIIINDWCYDNEKKLFNKDYYKAVIDGYNSTRKLKEIEINSLNIVLRAAAVRILVTRLHDYIFHPNDAIVIKKDPYQYINILNWHQNNLIVKL